MGVRSVRTKEELGHAWGRGFSFRDRMVKSRGFSELCGKVLRE